MANFKFRNAWSDAAREDHRFRDPIVPLELLEPPAADVAVAELVDQAAAAELAPGPADPLRPVAETWGSVHASGPRKITAAVLATAIKSHQDGRSWPAIARELGCHRMALYHALRRPPR